MCLNTEYEESDVYKWIYLPTTASCYNLKEFYLHLPSHYRLNLFVIRELPIDFHVLVPCLKTIRLRAISIAGVSTLNKLLSSCPRLKIFDTQDCILLSEHTLYPEVNVKKLYIKYHINPSRIMNEAGGRVLSTASANVDIDYNWGLTFDLLKPIFNIVKQLEICNPRIGSWDDNEATVWENLTHLVLKDHKYEDGYEALSFFLKRSPNLISLGLDKELPHEGEMISVVLPSVWYYKLETVKIIGFDGRREIEIAIWFLNNALIMKKLILCGRNLSEEIKTRIMDEPRASTSCEIQFYPF